MSDRPFVTSKTRKSELLDGVWSFSTAHKFTADVVVPSCWEQFPQLACYRGKGAYVREIDTDNGNLLFSFEGVSFFADVFFDGKKIKSHYGANTPFSALVPGVKKGKHTLKVVVSNEFNRKSGYHVPNDYYSYGGITRSVKMSYVNDNYIENVKLVPEKKDGRWTLGITATVKGCGRLTAYVGGKEYPLGEAKCGDNFFSADVGEVKLWSTKEPNLYEVQLVLVSDTGCDDLVERTGFREIRFDKDGFWLNGKKIFIRGFNRHEIYGDKGCALSLADMKNDIVLIKDMGGNGVRTSHYPNDRAFLDLCDEEGILVWEETHSRGLSIMQLHNPSYTRQIADCAKEMINAHIGHPCIVIWGCLNECGGNFLFNVGVHKRQLRQLKELDSRPVTYATCTPYKDRCLGLADVTSCNLYFGWYNADKPFVPSYRKLRSFLAEKFGERAFIVSEFGAGAIYGKHDEKRGRWSEEMQSDILARELEFYLGESDIAGIFIWQFCDIRVCEKEFPKRPGGKNNKGVVGENREKKLAYETVKKYYTNAALRDE